LAVLSACAGASTASADAPPAAKGANAAPGAAATCAAAAASEETLAVRNAYGAIEGTLVLPAGCGARPVALVVAGSGPTDRDGNQPTLRARPYALLASALAAQGIGSLRYDKAGIAASAKAAPAESDLRFEMGAADAALFVDRLRADPRVSKITIVGHSEGSLVAILAAARSPVDAYVSLAGAGRPSAQVLREQLAKNLTDAALLAKANTILDSLASGHTVADVPKELLALFRPSVQGYVISWMKHDPAADLAALAVPSVLVVQGSTDIQIAVADAQRLAASRPDAKLLVIDGMNHVLKAADASNASQRDAYTNPALPLVPELVSALVAAAGRR
jgi:pimeloyl-ACP methyl ester carboxylesterase